MLTRCSRGLYRGDSCESTWSTGWGEEKRNVRAHSGGTRYERRVRGSPRSKDQDREPLSSAEPPRLAFRPVGRFREDPASILGGQSCPPWTTEGLGGQETDG